LISGPVALVAPTGLVQVDVNTALEMERAVSERAEDCDLFVACAAVADYRPEEVLSSKIKKNSDRMELKLIRNPDILAAVAGQSSPPFTVGFAAETERVTEQAEKKRKLKGVDMIAANQVGANEGGFERDENAVTLLWEGGCVVLPLDKKEQLAKSLVAIITERYHAKNNTT